ncbi:Ig-like domain-containing protein, partial [Rhodobacter sp. Har01]|uniref:Ig-like domain-containing protein n=1 Tax=Rhodobacter sp. Har01 TaxID=2883999 RepID=UPI001D08B02A
DGTTWVTAGSFTHAMTVSATGVFASNSSNANGFTALVDYFETGTDPIQNEDGTITPVNLPPVAGDDALTTAEDSPLTFAAATLLGNDSDPNGTALSITAITQPANGTLTNLGNGSYTYTPTAGFSGSDSFTYTVSDGTLTDTATVTVLVGNPINVWYGLEQSFGAPGEGQRMINILGNVGDDVVSLSYSLNGAAFQTLSIGADTRRLQNPGDFNIDIDYARLNGTAVDDVVTIRATLGNGQIYTRDVIVNYQAGQTWAPNYSIDWATVTNLQDVVQVADGTWAHSAAGVRPVDLGYDRLLVLGDQAWDNYEARLTITMHNLTNEDPRGRDGGSLMLGALWDGHTDDPIRNWQPKSGWEPGTIFQYNTPNAAFSIYSYDDYRVRLDREPFVLQEGHTYNFTLRVEQTGLYDRLYSLKVWEVGTSEPVGWTVQGLETFTLAERPATGSLYLNAHYYDVTFGDIAVTEITGRDIIQGDSTAERLVAVNPGSAAPGRGEIDVFVGDGGADVFVFGDANGRYYDDGNAQNAGQGDYAFVWDFVSGTDQIELAGSAANYLLTSNAAGLPAGTAIWWDNAAGPDELIAVLNGVYGLNLGSSDFRFTETLLV